MRVGAALLSLALAGFAHSEQERYIDQVVAAIEQGGIVAVRGSLHVEGISGRPEWALRFCRAAAEADLKRLLHAKEGLREVAATIVEIGARAKARHEGDADALVASVEALYFQLRVRGVLRDEMDADDWLGLADELQALHELRPDGGKPLERAVRILREGKEARGVEAGPLAERENAICATGAKLDPKTTVFQSKALAGELEEIRGLLRTDRKEGAKRLKAYLRKNREGTDLDSVTSYNDAVTLAKENKRLGIRADYKTRTITLRKCLTLTLPAGRRWKKDKKTDSDLGDIRQFDREGKLNRKFSLDWFELNTLYTLGKKKFDGSNVKGIAMLSERDVKSVIIDFKRKTKVMKRKMNSKIGLVQFFEIGGLASDGEFVRFRTYIWKGHERTWLSYRLWIIEWDDFPSLDPEAKFVVDKFREVKYDGQRNGEDLYPLVTFVGQVGTPS
ncbi:MAG: hypothetical protein ACYTGV_14825 [Planctomycetota bacterium]|jgi:hypothetical protein